VVQDQILKEIKDLQKDLGFSMIVISHDVSVIAETCDHVLVMYGGKNFETGDTISIFKNPYNPYTVSLMKSFPSIRGPLRELSSIPGSPPDLVEPPSGCLFSPRCPLARERCFKEPPPLVNIKENHHSLCHFPDEANKLIASTW
jgi:oligopeptide/dipeptide ABC transporter ATP-binding protein